LAGAFGAAALGAAEGVFGFCGAALAPTHKATSKGRSLIDFCRLSTLFEATLFATMFFETLFVETMFSRALFLKIVFMANSWRANPI